MTTDQQPDTIAWTSCPITAIREERCGTIPQQLEPLFALMAAVEGADAAEARLRSISEPQLLVFKALPAEGAFGLDAFGDEWGAGLMTRPWSPDVYDLPAACFGAKAGDVDRCVERGGAIRFDDGGPRDPQRVVLLLVNLY